MVYTMGVKVGVVVVTEDADGVKNLNILKIGLSDRFLVISM